MVNRIVHRQIAHYSNTRVHCTDSTTLGAQRLQEAPQDVVFVAISTEVRVFPNRKDKLGQLGTSIRRHRKEADLETRDLESERVAYGACQISPPSSNSGVPKSPLPSNYLAPARAHMSP